MVGSGNKLGSLRNYGVMVRFIKLSLENDDDCLGRFYVCVKLVAAYNDDNCKRDIARVMQCRFNNPKTAAEFCWCENMKEIGQLRHLATSRSSS